MSFYENAVNSIKSKIPGPDGIVLIHIKQAKEEWKEMISEIATEMLQRGYFNTRINQGYILGLKKQDQKNQKNIE